MSFMSGNGAKGPSSTIFCLPILPQRGCSVGVVGVGRIAMHQIARAGLVDPILRDSRTNRDPTSRRGGKIAEEFVEAMHRRQILVQVAEMVLAELARGIALRLERGGERAGLGRQGRRRRPPGPTVVSPVRIGNSPVMKLARPAVQLASA